MREQREIVDKFFLSALDHTLNRFPSFRRFLRMSVSRKASRQWTRYFQQFSNCVPPKIFSLTIKLQNFARSRLQLKFAFTIRLFRLLCPWARHLTGRLYLWLVRQAVTW